MFSRLLWRPYILLQKNEIYNQDDAEGQCFQVKSSTSFVSSSSRLAVVLPC